MREQRTVFPSRRSRGSDARRAVFVVSAMAGAVWQASPTSASIKTFDGGGTGSLAYLTTNNWNDNVLPGTGDDVVFDNSLMTLTGATITTTGTASANNWTFGSANGAALGAFTFNSSGNSARSINLASGNITVDSTVTGTQSIGNGPGTSAVLTFIDSGGSLNLINNSTTQALTLGYVSAPSLNLSFSTAGGAINVDTVGTPTFGSLNGGNTNVQIYKNLTGSARTMTLNGTGSHSYSGVINGASLNLVVSGADNTFVQTLNGANTYSGSTTVTAGTLLINGSLQETGSVNVTGGTIGGSGSIYRTAVVTRSFVMAANTKLSPGGPGSAGTFSVNWNTGSSSTVDLSAASNNTGAYQFDLSTPAASDKLVVSAPGGSFNVGQLDFSDFSFTAAAGFGSGTYILFDGNSDATVGNAHSLVGTIGTASGVINGFAASLSIDAANDNVVLTVTPEPTVMAMFGILLPLLRRQKRQPMRR